MRQAGPVGDGASPGITTLLVSFRFTNPHFRAGDRALSVPPRRQAMSNTIWILLNASRVIILHLLSRKGAPHCSAQNDYFQTEKAPHPRFRVIRARPHIASGKPNRASLFANRDSASRLRKHGGGIYWGSGPNGRCEASIIPFNAPKAGQCRWGVKGAIFSDRQGFAPLSGRGKAAGRRAAREPARGHQPQRARPSGWRSRQTRKRPLGEPDLGIRIDRSEVQRSVASRTGEPLAALAI